MQLTHFMAREMRQWASDQSGNPLALPCSQHPEAADLKERWNSILKTQLQWQLGGSSLEGWGRVLQKAVYALNQCPGHCMFSLIVRTQGSWNQGVQKGIVPLTITLSDH